MKRGEIWWREAPGRKRRPVCVVTRDVAIPVLSRVIVAPATTRRRHIDSEVPLETEDGMPVACVLSFDNLMLSREALLTERITTLSPARMHEVCQALRFATGC